MTVNEPRPTTNTVGLPLPGDVHPLTLGTDSPVPRQNHSLIGTNVRCHRGRVPRGAARIKGRSVFGSPR